MTDRLLQWGVAVCTLAAVFAIAGANLYRMRPAPPPPPPPSCKVCHCGKASCHKECGEENMCAVRCTGLCENNRGR